MQVFKAIKMNMKINTLLLRLYLVFKTICNLPLFLRALGIQFVSLYVYFKSLYNFASSSESAFTEMTSSCEHGCVVMRTDSWLWAKANTITHSQLRLNHRQCRGSLQWTTVWMIVRAVRHSAGLNQSVCCTLCSHWDMELHINIIYQQRVPQRLSTRPQTFHLGR